MRVFSCMIVLALLALTSTGCSLFKKNKDSGSGTAGGSGPAPAKFPGSRDPLLPNNVPPPPSFPATNPNSPTTVPTSATSASSILAGTIVDAYHRPVGNAYIRWINLDEKDKESGAPIDVSANVNGHFIIQGVKPGTSYKLIARTKQGEKMLAGTVLTTAPNVRVVISIREDLVNSSTPPLPSAAYQGKTEESSKNTDWNAGVPNAPASDPLLGSSGAKTPEPNLPATMSVPAAPTNTPVGNPPPSASNPSFVPGVVENPTVRVPMLSIPNSGARPIVPESPARPPGLTPEDAKLDTGPTRVPSCVLVGSHLENLALKDSKGQTWEYKKNGAGKMVLIDFWGTHCIYCRDSMPVLNRLHTQYGSRGLEVIGIAVEPGQDQRRECDAVNKQCASLHVTYRQLMGHVGAFDASKQFKVEGLPTLILLSEQGDIIWHHVGRPDPALLNALERTIQSRLTNKTASAP